MQYKKAVLLSKAKEVRDDGTIVEIVIWRVPEPVWPCLHSFKYRLFFGAPGRECVRYDNERGKGDHRHVGGQEEPYAFQSVERLLDDFEDDVKKWSAA